MLKYYLIFTTISVKLFMNPESSWYILSGLEKSGANFRKKKKTL